MKIRILTLCASFLIILSIFSGCKITDDQPQLDSLSILGSDVISIEIGEEITVETDAPEGTKLVWTSSSMSAVLTDHGRIMGMKAGKAIITVSYGDPPSRTRWQKMSEARSALRLSRRIRSSSPGRSFSGSITAPR